MTHSRRSGAADLPGHDRVRARVADVMKGSFMASGGRKESFMTFRRRQPRGQLRQGARIGVRLTALEESEPAGKRLE
jgi:hypothetical protein